MLYSVLYVVCSSMFNTASAVPHCVSTGFLRRTNLRLAFVSALLMCSFYVFHLLKVTPWNFSLSVCLRSVGFSMILTDFILVDSVNNVVNLLFRFIFPHHSFAQFESTLTAVWSHVWAVATYSSVFHITKSSVYMALLGSAFTKSFMNTINMVADRIPPCGTP